MNKVMMRTTFEREIPIPNCRDFGKSGTKDTMLDLKDLKKYCRAQLQFALTA